MNLTPQTEFWRGVRDTFPLIVGAIPFGIIFGTLSESGGLSLWGALAFSAIVFAGSAQFIALGMVSAGATWPVIVLTTFVVNLRHLLYSTTLLQQVRHTPAPRQLVSLIEVHLRELSETTGVVVA